MIAGNRVARGQTSGAVFRRVFAPLSISLLVACRATPEAGSPADVPAIDAPESSEQVSLEPVEPPVADGPDTFEGRTIAPTMSHLGADWLTRPERIVEEDPDALHRALELTAGRTACDVGAGNGYHTIRLARAVAPGGRVIASDLQPEMLELLREQLAAQKVEGVEVVLAKPDDPALPPGACDLILLVDVYHELSHPEAVLAAMHRALTPKGRLVLVEFRGEDPDVPIKPEHKMTKAQIRKELEPRGFVLAEEIDVLPWQHVMAFARREPQ